MIPVRLELYNFLAYRDPAPLDFTGLHVACLVGANGAGKSSLLDAITWSLWGRARARRDDELIHADQPEMQVTLEFLLDGNCYRVTRYRSRERGGNSILTLEIQDGEEWRGISESTIRATQIKLNRLLRLDYETFINSAFLAQGRADEFTRKTSGERKTILGDILGLDAWVGYEDRVKQRARSLDAESRQIDTYIEQIDAELAREGEFRAELDALRQDLDVLVQDVRDAEQAFSQMEESARRQQDLRGRYDDLDRRVQEGMREIERIESERGPKQAQLDALRSLLDAREQIEAGHERLRAARDSEREYGDRLIAQSELSTQLSALQQTIAAARSDLQGELRALETRAEELGRTIAEGVEDATLQETLADIAGLEAREVERDELTGRLGQLREERAGLNSTNIALRGEIKVLDGQREQIEAATEPVCPLCQQELSDEHRADLLARLGGEREEKAELGIANKDQIEALDGEIRELEREIDRANGELRRLQARRDQAAKYQDRIERTQSAQTNLVAVNERLDALSSALQAEDYAHEAQAELAALQDELSAVGYDEAAHRAARDEIRALEGIEAQKQDLDRALDRIPELEQELADRAGQIENWLSRIQEDQTTLEGWVTEIAALDEALVNYAQAEADMTRLRDAEGQKRYNIGQAEQRVNALDTQRQRRDNLVLRRDEVAEEQGIYDDLRQAFGKDGIPAMIIEAAIPELEKEANEILTQMTDGQMYIQFDTQREKVTGGTKETLDIRISDALGTRDYANYSGGEAFRVNFSIRLAMSKMLARRAGAQLRTLIIDEGFGTQDAQGRERLIGAINTIKDDFDLILVITHIDELKDAFPARIEITKLPDGSVIEII